MMKTVKVRAKPRLSVDDLFRYYFENKYNCWTEKTKKLRISDGGDGSGSGLQYWEGV